MDKRVILAIAAILVVGIMLGATGVMAKDVRANDDGTDVAAALAAKLEDATGAEVPPEVIQSFLDAAAAKGEGLGMGDVDDLVIIDHGADVGESAWDLNVVGPFIPWQIHYFPSHPQFQTCAAIIWDDTANDLDMFVSTAGGFGMSIDVNSLTEETAPIPTYAPWPFFFNWGTFVAVNHWSGPTNQFYVVAVDGC